jgi:prepilin-type N-terminal cleavage/methylation domain-containing protein
VSDRLARDERGMTLAELMIALTLMAVVLAVMLPQLAGALTVYNKTQNRAGTIDAAQEALIQLERDARSADLITTPTAVGGIAGLDVRMETSSQGTTPVCVEYQVGGAELLRRIRPDGAANASLWPSTWDQVATGVVNAVTAPPVAAFTLSPDGRQLSIDLLVDQAETSAATVELSSTVVGLDIPFTDAAPSPSPC